MREKQVTAQRSRTFGTRDQRQFNGMQRAWRRDMLARASSACVSAMVALLGWCTEAAACPNCPVGETAREQVFGPGFATNLATAALPFLLVGIATLYAERIGRPH